MKNKQRAEKKAQIVIDKLLDILDLVPALTEPTRRMLDSARELQSKIRNLKT